MEKYTDTKDIQKWNKKVSSELQNKQTQEHREDEKRKIGRGIKREREGEKKSQRGSIFNEPSKCEKIRTKSWKRKLETQSSKKGCFHFS